MIRDDAWYRRAFRRSLAGMVLALGLLAVSMIIVPWWHWILFGVAGVACLAIIIAYPVRPESRE